MEALSGSTNPKTRPQLLTVLAILSFIGSGMSLFSYVVISFGFDAVVNILETEMKDVYPEMLVGFIKDAGKTFFRIGSLAYAVSLFGVYKMWNLQKIGLHYYAISQFVILLLPLIFISTKLSILPGLLITLFFIVLYNRSFNIIEKQK